MYVQYSVHTVLRTYEHPDITQPGCTRPFCLPWCPASPITTRPITASKRAEFGPIGNIKLPTTSPTAAQDVGLPRVLRCRKKLVLVSNEGGGKKPSVHPRVSSSFPALWCTTKVVCYSVYAPHLKSCTRHMPTNRWEHDGEPSTTPQTCYRERERESYRISRRDFPVRYINFHVTKS